jgi:hypothetical protein
MQAEAVPSDRRFLSQMGPQRRRHRGLRVPGDQGILSLASHPSGRSSACSTEISCPSSPEAPRGKLRTGDHSSSAQTAKVTLILPLSLSLSLSLSPCLCLSLSLSPCLCLLIDLSSPLPVTISSSSPVTACGMSSQTMRLFSSFIHNWWKARLLPPLAPLTPFSLMSRSNESPQWLVTICCWNASSGGATTT